MKYIVGTDRSQINLFPVSFDQSIEHDNEVHLIDPAQLSMAGSLAIMLKKTLQKLKVCD